MTNMLDYINEQPRIGRRILEAEKRTMLPLDNVLQQQPVRNVLFLATGSSMNSVIATVNYFERLTNATVFTVEPFTYTTYGINHGDIDLVIAVSQRGTSSSTIEAVQAARERTGAPIVVLTGHPDSPITQYTDCTIDINCGPEEVPYSTMGVYATVLSLHLVAIRIAEHAGRNIPARLDRQALREVTESTPRIIETSTSYFNAHASSLAAASRLTILGSGPNLGTCKEAETKIIETVRVPVQGFELEAYMHGPLFELRPHYTVFLIEIPGSAAASRTRQLAQFLERHCDNVHIVSAGKAANTRELGLGIDCDELISPLALIIPFQIFAYRMSEARGVDLTVPAFPDFRQAMKSKVSG